MKHLLHHKNFITESLKPILYQLSIFEIRFETNDTSDTIYIGIDYENAKYEYDNFDEIPNNWKNRTDMTVNMVKKTDDYQFIYNLDDEYESIEDYPIEDYYNDSSYYHLLTDNEYDCMYFRSIGAFNEKSDDTLKNVDDYFKSKYGKYKYNIIRIENDQEEIFTIKLRITDHTENIMNIDRYEQCDYYISVVICDYDTTKDRFNANAFERRSNEYELVYDSKISSEDIIAEIDGKISDITKNL